MEFLSIAFALDPICTTKFSNRNNLIESTFKSDRLNGNYGSYNTIWEIYQSNISPFRKSEISFHWIFSIWMFEF